jgi:hypothetical protein
MNLPNADVATLIIWAFYLVSACVGIVCSKPKLAFYVSVCLALVACAALFYLKIYIEMGGLFHTTPFAIIPWWISRYRQKRKASKAASAPGE